MATPRNARPGMLLDPGAPINKGLVGWWPMWEGAGGKTLDISGKNNHGTLTNGPVWAGGGLKFDGTDDYVTIPNGADLLSGNNTTTLSAWFTRESSTGTYPGIISSIASALTLGYEFSNADSASLFIWRGGSYRTYTLTSTYIDGKLHHIAAAYTASGDNLNLYIDGILQTSFTGTVASMRTETGALEIGRGNADGVNSFKGIIKSAQVWSRALSALEVRQLYVNPNIGLWVPDITRYYIPAAGGGFQPAWAANSNVLLGGGMAL